MDTLSTSEQSPGRYLGIIGHNPSVPKTNWLHVVIFWFLINIKGYFIHSSKMISNFLNSWTSIGSQIQGVHI